MQDSPRRRLRSFLGVDGTRAPVPTQHPRNRRLLTVALALFLVLNVLTASWLYVALAGAWLLLLVAREVVERRNR